MKVSSSIVICSRSGTATQSRVRQVANLSSFLISASNLDEHTSASQRGPNCVGNPQYGGIPLPYGSFSTRNRLCCRRRRNRAYDAELHQTTKNLSSRPRYLSIFHMHASASSNLDPSFVPSHRSLSKSEPFLLLTKSSRHNLTLAPLPFPPMFSTSLNPSFRSDPPCRLYSSRGPRSPSFDKV